MMISKGFISAVWMAAAAANVCAVEYETGKIIAEVRCGKAASYSYMLYLPAGYTPGREVKWPVLFVMGPDGGTEEGMRRYIKGAEQNNWIVVMSIQSKDGFRQSKHAVAAMFVDVLKRFPVDPQRCYASGMSGGARLAFWLANEKPKTIIGIIPCGGGDVGNRYTRGALAYGLCGGRSFSRWDMAITFNEHIRDKGRLRFFKGGHDWADEELICDAMTWLNAKYLAEEGTTGEIDRFSEKLFKEILERYETNPWFTYGNAVILAGVEQAPQAGQAREIADRLATEPRIESYLEGLKEIDDFVEKHFNTAVYDFRNNPLTRRQKEDADELLAKYRETPLAGIIEDFGKPSDQH